METNKPIHKLREGRVKAAIWVNKTNEGKTFPNVTFSRTYRTGEQFRDSISFGRGDLVSLAKLAQDAHAYLAQTEEQAG